MDSKMHYHDLDSDDASCSSDTLLRSECSSVANENHASSHNLTTEKRSPFWRRHICSLLAHALLFGLNVSIGYLVVRWATRTDMQFVGSLGGTAQVDLGIQKVQFDTVSTVLHDGTTNPEKKTAFGGNPRPELDEAWKTSYTQYTTISVHEDELDVAINKTDLVKLPDGSYLGSLGVFHGLHCVERLHHYLYKDEYYPHLSEAEAGSLFMHTEHCVDWIRQYVQCNVDMTFIMMHWEDGKRFPLSADTSEHQCKNFDTARNWAAGRKLDLFEPGLLVHPKLGVIFDDAPGGSKGNVVGIER